MFCYYTIYEIRLTNQDKNMSYSSTYGGYIWTKHVLERLGQRGLTQERVFNTVAYADKTVRGKKQGTIEFHKKFQQSWVTVITVKTEKGETLLLSAWIDPPLYGTEDYHKKQSYHAYHKAGFWGKLWLIVKEQFGFV